MTLVQGQKDLLFAQKTDAEMFKRIYPPTTWWNIDQTEARQNIYGEADANKEDLYKAWPQSVHLFIEMNPSEKMLTKLGITDKQDCVFEFSKYYCDQFGLVPKIGDRFLWGDIQFEVMNISEGAFFVNYHSKALHYVGTAKKARTWKSD